MKLNKKGFAISTVLYGLLALLILIVMLMFQIMRTNNNNSKSLGKEIQKELNYCRAKRIVYNECYAGECNTLQQDYTNCLKKCKTDPNDDECK